MEGPTLSPLVLVEAGRSDQKLLYFAQGRITLAQDTLSLRTAGYTLETAPESVFGPLFSQDVLLKRFFVDLDFLNRELAAVFVNSLPAFYFTVLVLVIAFYSCGMFLRLTRWHLLNAALALLALRGLLALFRFMREGVVFELDKILSNPAAVQFLPELALAVLGGLILLLDLLFVPFRRWQEE
jgi:hypothetical protein